MSASQPPRSAYAFDTSPVTQACRKDTVFQKEPPGERTVCYCFAVSEGDIRHELVETGRSTAGDRITALVKAGRCACEVKNPQGTCCLGNLATATKAARATLGDERVQDPEEAPRHP